MKEFEEDIFEDEDSGIDIFAIAGLVWRKKLTVLKVTLCFMGMGLFLAFFSPSVYTSQCVFVPQMSHGLSSQYSSLASMIGMDVALSSGGNDGQVNPRLYPLILENPNFLKDLMYSKVHVEKASQPVTLFDYFTNPKDYQKFNLVGVVAKYTVGLPMTLKNLIIKPKDPVVFETALAHSGDGPSPEPVIQFTRDENTVAGILLKNIEIDVDVKKGYLTMTAKMPEAQASTEMCQAAYNLLQEYVRDYKRIKSQANLSFISSELKYARNDYENAQVALAKFMDSNFGIDKATAKIQKIRLQSDYELAKQMFTELSRQELSSKVKVNEDTIAFTELAPPSVPLERTSPKRTMMLIVWTFLGIFCSFAYLIVKDKYSSRKAAGA